MSRKEEAEALFRGGFNCAQSLLASYGAGFGIEREAALRLASAMGGGMARSGEVCGAVSGGIMVIGLGFGPANAWNKLQMGRVRKKAADFIEEFRAAHGGIRCRDLVGVNLETREGRREARRRRLFETRCANYVRGAADILERLVPEAR
ncbi:MAG: C-GCAxxG-C-C family protein [Nitrospirota bacterium]|jgi:C_GCAxxG_C_C family probable redox protein